jgi:glutamate-5-semialdehyde dehydrogenase
MLLKEPNYPALFEKAKLTSRKRVAQNIINSVLRSLAEETVEQTAYLLKENQKDLDRMDHRDPKYDRLRLTPDRVKDIADEIRNVARLKSPLGRVLSKKTMPNGLEISKVSVPLGVVGVIYEARPNVTLDGIIQTMLYLVLYDGYWRFMRSTQIGSLCSHRIARQQMLC